MWVTEKSGTVSRQPPRSSASTLAPASVSSCAITEAVQPKPTSTTSTSGSFFAIRDFPRARLFRSWW